MRSFAFITVICQVLWKAHGTSFLRKSILPTRTLVDETTNEEDIQWFERILQDLSSIDAPASSFLCSTEVSLDCTYADDSGVIACSALPVIDEPYCLCSECAQELVFTFTGKECSASDLDCIDIPSNTTGDSTLRFSICNSDIILYETMTTVGETISLSPTTLECLPECVEVNILEPISGDLTQTFTINSSCNNRDLLLKDSLGALDFVGYTCESGEPKNCFQEVEYTVSACNLGSDVLSLNELSLEFDGEYNDLLEASSFQLSAGECFDSAMQKAVDRCIEVEYSAKVAANATNSLGGLDCGHQKEYNFEVTPVTSAPTSAPSSTGPCNLDLVIEPKCPTIQCGWDRCRERPFRMEFRMEPRACEESLLRRCPGQDPDSCTCIRNTTIAEDDWPEQKFECTDFNGGPVEDSGSYFVVATPEKDPSTIYFQGRVQAGTTFNATEPSLGPVEANTYLDLYQFNEDTQLPGLLLQRVLFHSSCSKQLYLLDVFGSFQLIEFESDNQFVGFGINPEVSFNLAFEIAGPELTLEFFNIVVLSNFEGLIPPQIEEFDVVDMSIPPSVQTTTEIILIPDQEFTVIATVGGELGGNICFELSESLITCPGVAEPER